MKHWIKIKAETHSNPTYFYLEDKRLEIEDILDRWYQGNLNPEFPESNYWKIRINSGEEFLLKQEIRSGNWLCRKL